MTNSFISFLFKIGVDLKKIELINVINWVVGYQKVGSKIILFFQNLVLRIVLGWFYQNLTSKFIQDV